MAAPPTSALVPQLPKPPDPSRSASPNVVASGSSPMNDGTAANNSSISFAAIAAKARVIDRYPDVPLPARQYGQKEGVPAVVFSASEHQALTQRIRHTVIAKFQNSRPHLSIIKAFVESNWRIKGRVTISSNWDARHVVFMLDSEEDVNQALVCPHRKIQHAYFRLFRWSVDYNPKKETTRVTKWIKLPGLPMEFFTKSSVKAIVSSFAHFLDIDDRTHSMNSLQCARACVELDIMKQIPSQVWISVGDKSFYQDIVVEGGIAYCMKCKIHGHNVETCRKALRIIEQGKTDKVAEVSAAKEANSTAGEKNKVRNEWTVVQHKRKAVRNPLSSKDNSNNVAVASTGLINRQNMIDDSIELPPHKVPDGSVSQHVGDETGEKMSGTNLMIQDVPKDDVRDKETNNACLEESKQVADPKDKEHVDCKNEKRKSKDGDSNEALTIRPNILVPKSAMDVSISATGSLLLGSRDAFQPAQIRPHDSEIVQITEDSTKSSKSDV